MSLLAFENAVDIGGGRGRLAAPAAASLARVDAAFRSSFGRAADINEAWRSPQQADANYRAYQAWLAYQAGRGPRVPRAPIAFAAKDSIHCRGYALDTDDTSDAQMRIWNDHGWFWTVYRNGKLAERWHLEYFRDRDNHRNDPAPAGGATTAPPVPEEDEDMRLIAWNGRAWVVSDEKVAYVRNDRESLQMAKLLTKQSAAFDITNDQLTELLFILAIPWAALDATFKSQAFDNASKWGKGTVWSRQIAEGHEDSLRDASLARNLDDLAKSVNGTAA